jgi:hypothetical protein
LVARAHRNPTAAMTNNTRAYLERRFLIETPDPKSERETAREWNTPRSVRVFLARPGSQTQRKQVRLERYGDRNLERCVWAHSDSNFV